MNENFSEKTLRAKGFPLGLITDGDITDKPFESVQGGQNIDYFGDRVKRRDALEYIHRSISLPSGYAIAKITEKNIIDKDGSTITVYFVFATKSGSRIRIYVSKWYNPAFLVSGKYYQNSQGATTGWADGFKELTESYDLDLDTGDYQIGTDGLISGSTGLRTTNVQSTDANITDKATDYFRGFFAYEKYSLGVSNARFIGIVTGSYQRDSGNHVICIRTDYKPDVAGTDITYEVFNDTVLTGITLVRFPFVNTMLNYTAVSEISIANYPNNAMAISLGEAYEPIWLGFIANKQVLKNILEQNTDTHTGHISEIKLDSPYDVLQITLSDTIPSPEGKYIQLAGITGDFSILNGNIYKIHSISTSVLECYFTGTHDTLTTPSTDGTVTFVTDKETYGNYWDGFWLSELTPKISNIEKRYMSYAQVYTAYNEYANDCGIIFGVIASNITGVLDHKNRMTGLAVEYDGFNEFFLKIAASRISASVTIENTFSIILKGNFDRRISGFKTFYKYSDSELYIDKTLTEGSNSELEFKNTDYLPYQLIKEEGGEIKIEEIDSNLKYFYILTPFAGTIERSNTGSNINNFLGHYYYNVPYLKCKGFTYAAGYLLAYGISQDSFEGDYNNKRLIAVSNLQQSIVPSSAAFSIERTISCEDEPIKVVGLYYNRIAYYTNLIFKALEIKNIIAIEVNEIFRGLNMGLPNQNAVVEAKVKNEYGGIYWTTPNDDVYRYIDDKPEFLMKGRILDQWLALGSKTNVRVGYHQEERDVIFYYDKDRIYVYNILYNNWRQYVFPVEVKLCSTSQNGYLLAFTNTDIIKKSKQTAYTSDLYYAVSSGVESALNGNFETGDLTNWTATIDTPGGTPCGEVKVYAGQGYGSSQGCKFTRAVSLQGVMKLSQTIAVSESSLYTFGYYQKNIAELYNGVLVYIRDIVNNKYLNAGGGSWATSKTYCFSGTYADWTLCQVTFATLTGCTSLEIFFEETAANLQNNEQIIDNVSLIKTNETEYGIELSMGKWVNLGTNTVYKLFNRIEAISDVQFLERYSSSKITYAIYGSDNVLLFSEDYGTATLNKKINFSQYSRISDVSFYLLISSSLGKGITEFQLYELVFNALIRRRGLAD